MGDRDFEEGRYFALKLVLEEFCAVFGEEPDTEQARDFRDALLSEIGAVLANLES